MSYDLMVFEPKDAPREKAAFLDWYRLQTQHPSGDGISATAPGLAAWYEEMCREFPDMNGPRADELADSDDGARATGYSIGRSAIYADFRWPKADAALRAVRVSAVRHGVGFFNVSATDGEIWFPPTDHQPDRSAISGLTLSLEGQQPFEDPSMALIEAAVDWLEPERGPGFLILERRAGGDYAQAAGGKGACTVEWREYRNDDFRHCVAGCDDGDRETGAEIPRNGRVLPVKANERLGNDSVKAILSAFARAASMPKGFVWRDISADFGGGSPPADPKPWWKFWRG